MKTLEIMILTADAHPEVMERVIVTRMYRVRPLSVMLTRYAEEMRPMWVKTDFYLMCFFFTGIHFLLASSGRKPNNR
jgi:hypothetical protein